MSKAYFGCGMMDMTDAQDKELRRMHEKALTRKLRLGSNFPKKNILCGRVPEMIIGIVAPEKQ